MKIKQNNRSTSYPTVTFILIYILLIFFYPEKSSEGIINGMQLSFNILIPSLYPFMFCTAFFVKSGILQRIRQKELSIFLLSLLGGYPMGAKCISELYESGVTDKNGAKKLLSFCINPSVSFVFSTVGLAVLRSRSAGLVILSAILVSSLTMFSVTAFFCRKNKIESTDKELIVREDFSGAFVASLKDGLASIILICGFVIFFSSVSSIAEVLPINEKLKLILRCVLEVTSGVVLTAENFSLPFVSALISFGGFSTLFQLKAILQKTDITFKEILIFRLASAVFSGLYTAIILNFFPISAETFGADGFKLSLAPSYSVSVSLCMILMSILFIMGDSIIVKNNLTEKGSESTIKTV